VDLFGWTCGVYELVDTCGVYELVDVIYMCYLLLPRGAVGKGTFAEGSGQLHLATLGKICPAWVFPASLSIVARALGKEFF
jgi:hypothetical protein